MAEFENRSLRADGTERWLQWSVRPVTGGGLIYAAARDVTERRRAAREQTALRRVTTLVARGVPLREVFSEVADQVGNVLAAAPPPSWATAPTEPPPSSAPPTVP